MTQVANASIGTARDLDVERAHRFSTDWRRWLQLALAALWVFDGLLQYQTFMFTKDFAKQILVPTASGNPAWISDSIQWAAHIVESNPVPIDAAFGTFQLAIGLAIAWRRSLKVGLAVSIAWSLLVWWFGEGLGGLLTGSAIALMGAPGAVLLYLVLAVLLWPTARSTVGSFVASQPVGRTAAKLIWVVLWAGLAALNLQPVNLSAGALYSMEDGMADGQPGWLAGLITAFTNLSRHNGIALTVIGTAVVLLVAVSVLLPARMHRAGVIAGIVVAAFIWVFGEALGGVFGGRGTDVNSGPLLALIALAYWPNTATSRASVTAGEAA